MEILFELEKSKIEGIKYYGKLILSAEGNEIKIDVTVRENEEELYVCYPSKKSTKDGKYYNTVFLDNKLYEKVNKKLNREFK